MTRPNFQQCAFRIPKDLHNRLRELADGRPMSVMVAKAIAAWVEANDKQVKA